MPDAAIRKLVPEDAPRLANIAADESDATPAFGRVGPRVGAEPGNLTARGLHGSAGALPEPIRPVLPRNRGVSRERYRFAQRTSQGHVAARQQVAGM